MKAILTQAEEPKFTPVTISITIDNQNDYDLLTSMSALGMTLSEKFAIVLSKRNDKLADKAYGFMQRFLKCISNVVAPE